MPDSMGIWDDGNVVLGGMAMKKAKVYSRRFWDEKLVEIQERRSFDANDGFAQLEKRLGRPITHDEFLMWRDYILFDWIVER